MRKHLYRGKRADNGEWVEGDLLTNGIDYETAIRVHNANENSDSAVIAVLPETVGEYTGLTDKNGKMTFEGYICTDGENIYEVIFDEYQFSVKVIKTPLYLIKKGDIFPLWQFDNCERNGYRQLEIIGNIHDNPELNPFPLLRA